MPTTAGQHHRDHRHQRGQHAVQRLRGFLLEGVGGLQQHRVERAGFLADLDHLQRQPRETLALGQRGRQADAVLDLVGRGFDIGGEHAVAEHVAADAERGQQRHAVLQQRAERARQARGLELGHQRAGEASCRSSHASKRVAERRVAALAIEPPQRQRRHHQQHDPPVAHEQADAEHEAREHRQLGVEAFVHRRELRHHVAEQEQQRRPTIASRIAG